MKQIRISLLDKVFSGCFKQAFFIWETKKSLLVALDRWSSYTETIVWGFAWADSALGVLGKWSSYRCGCLSSFDSNALS